MTSKIMAVVLLLSSFGLAQFAGDPGVGDQPVSGGGGTTTTARHFTGTDNLTSAGSQTYLTGAGTFTVAAWVKLTATGTTTSYAMVEYDNATSNGWEIIYGYTNNCFEFYAPGFSGSDPRTSSCITVTDTNWHHIAYRHTAGGAWDKFLDGTKTSINASITFTLFAATGPLTVGTDNGHSVPAGNIARVFISTAAESDAFIAQLAGSTCSSTTPNSASGTIAYWPILGSSSPEPEHAPSPNSVTLTVTGTTQVTGPTCSSI